MGGGVLCYSTHRGWASTADETQFWPRLGSDGSKGRLRTRFSPQKRPVKIKQISSQDVFCRVMAGWAARPPTVTAHPAGIHCRFAEYPAATPK